MANDVAIIDDEPDKARDTEKAKPISMTEADIAKLIAREIQASESNDDSDLSTQRTKALEYFDGVLKDLEHEVGRSSVVSRDVSDAIGWTLPQMMQVFCASEHMVMAEAVGDDDDEWADNATLGLNHLFWKDNNGYRILRDATFDALLLKNAIIKVYNDDTPIYEVTFHSGLSTEALTELLDDENVDVLQHTASTEMEDTIVMDPMTGQPTKSQIEMTVHEVKIKRLKSKSRRVIECIPPEDYLQDADAVFTALARFRAHRNRKTRSDLIEMGFDPKEVADLSITGSTGDKAEKRAREFTENGEGIADRSMQEIDLYECYERVDVDGDGVAETIRAFWAGGKDGGTLLDWEIWEDEGPFYDIPCDPIPHRWDGKSLADDTMDVMKNKTALLRQFHDNVYASNNPQRFAKGNIINPEELFSPTFGSTIFGDVTSDVTNLSVPFVAGSALQALAYQDEMAQRRTGVSRQSMALDPEELQNQSATANQNNKDASYSQVELMARDMAELGWKPVFRALLKLEIKHQDTPRTIRMGGKPVRIDPKSWNADMDITVNVGLGTGSRQRDMAMLRIVLEGQLAMVDRFMANGAIDDAIDMLPKIIDTQIKIGESAGLNNPRSFYPDFTEDKIAQLKQLAAERAKQPPIELQIAQGKQQIQIEGEKAKAQASVIKEKAQLDADIETEQQKQAFEREKFQRDHEYRMAQLAQDRELRLLELRIVERPAADGEPGHVTTMDAQTDALMQGLGAISQMVAQLGAHLSAPTEIVRDPSTGKAVGSRKVMQ